MKRLLVIISLFLSISCLAVECKELKKSYDVCGEVRLVNNETQFDLEDSLYEKVLLRDEDLSLSQVENKSKQLKCIQNKRPAQIVCLNLKDLEKKVSQNFIEDLF